VKVFGEVEVTRAFESSTVSIEVKLGEEIMFTGIPTNFTTENGLMKVPFSFNLSDAQLWWPHNVGNPYLYEFIVRLFEVQGYD
jgi:beta-galactosidase/beta-glucuronidase